MSGLHEAFASVLAAGRRQFNARAAEARHQYPALDTAAFAAFLGTAVDPVVAAVHAVDAPRVAPVAVVAYEMALELVGQALAGPGARVGVVDRLWQAVAPRYARLIAAQPREVLGALSNAAIAVAKVEDARVDEWLAGLAALAPRVDTLSQLRGIGQVLAWRAGLAHFRAGAIAAADGLPEALALAAVDATGSWSATRAALLASPWACDDARRRALIGGLAVGRFTGFGGSFAEPPEVKAVTDGFLISSGERYAFLVADAFGAVLHPATEEEYRAAGAANPRASAPAVKGSQLVLNGHSFATGLPERGLAMTWNAHTVAAYSPWSFTIRVAPLA